jgi:hypothetical protein
LFEKVFCGAGAGMKPNLNLRQMHEFMPQNWLKILIRVIAQEDPIAADECGNRERSRRLAGRVVVVHPKLLWQLMFEGAEPPPGLLRKQGPTIQATRLSQ